MATDKNKMSIINKEDIKNALEEFKLSYKENKEKYEEDNIKVEDVVTLTEGFSGKSAIFAATVITAVMIVMPPKEFMVLMDTAKSISKEKLFKAVNEIIDEKI